MQKKDELFQINDGKKFEFDEQVASVFDDMLNRSIPFYAQNLSLCIDFLQAFAPDSETLRIYDLGCSTGNTLLSIWERFQNLDSVNLELIGLDSSSAMIENARLKAKALGANITFEIADFLDSEFLQSCAFLANYTLQFIAPNKRKNLMQKIFENLKAGGIFIMSEKMACESAEMDSAFISRYHALKEQNGYSKTQIALKRGALENVLIPLTLNENLELLKSTGFSSVEVLFKWVNFGTIIARK